VLDSYVEVLYHTMCENIARGFYRGRSKQLERYCVLHLVQ
jgi:hypothetical protein